MRVGLQAGWLRKWIIIGGAVFPLFVLFALFLPNPLFDPGYSTVLLASRGELLGASISRDGQWRFPPNGPVSTKFEKALITFEDKRFYSHAGVDVPAIVRALGANIAKKKVVSGASTITMQVVRLSRGTNDRTIAEKCVEMILAFRLELTESKKGILALFSAHAPFGGNVVGIGAASWRYFGRGPDRLSWAEAAMLAVLPNNPGLLRPGKNSDLLEAKRNALLRKLRAGKIIDDDTYLLAIAEALPASPYPLPQDAMHLLGRIRQSGKYDKRARITTTIDYNLQLHVTEIAKKYHDQYLGYGIKNIAAIVLDVDTCRILAYLGNIFDEHADEKNGYVDIAASPRSTGSLLKPFLFAASLDSGEVYPNQLLMDVPSRLGSYIPENNSQTFGGAVTAHDALVQSLNIPFVLLLRSYGLDRFYSLLKDLGMTTFVRSAQEYGLPLVVGGAEGRLDELTAMYAGLVRSAKQSAPQPGFIPARAVPGDLPDNRVYPHNPISPQAAWITLTALLDVVRPGEEGVWREYLSSKKIAWKTGTSYGYRDAWAIGVTAKYAVGIWVGNAGGEGRPELRGAHVAAPVLFEIFSGLADSDWIPQPKSGLSLARVCSKSGFPAGPSCVETEEVFVPATSKPQRICPYCRIVHLDPSGSWQVTSDCEQVSRIRNVSWFVLTPAMEWYYKKSHSGYRPLPPFKPGCREDTSTRAMSILYPEQGASIYIPVELDGKPGKTVSQAAHRDSAAVIYWHIDGVFFGETKTFHQIEFRLGAGRHVITAVDGSGNVIEREFFILSGK